MKKVSIYTKLKRFHNKTNVLQTMTVNYLRLKLNRCIEIPSDAYTNTTKKLTPIFHGLASRQGNESIINLYIEAKIVT